MAIIVFVSTSFGIEKLNILLLQVNRNYTIKFRDFQLKKYTITLVRWGSRGGRGTGEEEYNQFLHFHSLNNLISGSPLLKQKDTNFSYSRWQVNEVEILSEQSDISTEFHLYSQSSATYITLAFNLIVSAKI